MKLRPYLLSLAIFCQPSFAFADAVIPRFNFKLSVRFENLSDYPERDFYVKYNLRTVKVESGEAVCLGSRVHGAMLFAVPRGSDIPHSVAWNWRPPNAMEANLQGISTDFGDREVTYRVLIEGRTLSTKLVASHSLGAMMFWGIAIILPIFLIAIGIWIHRRKATAPSV
ncbi:MAG TPA: hypothetical protein VFE62_06460 [Gemmataceae bacterium]|nr:hypothetical protein [Gemmataceae bacterium]